jgi:hypothetical protein
MNIAVSERTKEIFNVAADIKKLPNTFAQFVILNL